MIFRVICHEVVFLFSFVVLSRLLFFSFFRFDIPLVLRWFVFFCSCFRFFLAYSLFVLELFFFSITSSVVFPLVSSLLYAFSLFCLVFFLFRKKIVCTFRGISGLPRILVLSRKVNVRLSFYDRSF